MDQFVPITCNDQKLAKYSLNLTPRSLHNLTNTKAKCTISTSSIFIKKKKKTMNLDDFKKVNLLYCVGHYLILCL